MLQGIDGVNTSEALADAMIYRQVFACIEFKHDAVSVLENVPLFIEANKKPNEFY